MVLAGTVACACTTPVDPVVVVAAGIIVVLWLTTVMPRRARNLCRAPPRGAAVTVCVEATTFGCVVITSWARAGSPKKPATATTAHANIHLPMLQLLLMRTR